MVQGKQVKAVSELLLSKGIPKKWIQVEDHTQKKKK
jgi:translation initiation factor 2D